MTRNMLLASLSFVALSLGAAPASAAITAPTVERIAPEKVAVRWTATKAVDVFLARSADAGIEDATLISKDDKDGVAEIAVTGPARPYFLLRDKDGVVRVAERLLPLETGSNFRDIGGYATADGRHVRWGMIYRSGATALLNKDDLGEVQALGLANMVDLRSDEERVLAPSRVDGVPYSAVGYSMTAITANIGNSGQLKNGGTIYRNFPTMLAPQLRVLFSRLLAKEGPLAYNCSAGQDRTGFATAMILSALGVPRETILADYHLSTAYRQPANEMPKIDTVAHAGNPVAMFFAKYQQEPNVKPQPLKDENGKAFLSDAFEEVEARWGSVEAYLEKEVGVDKVEIAALRAAYLQ